MPAHPSHAPRTPSNEPYRISEEIMLESAQRDAFETQQRWQSAEESGANRVPSRYVSTATESKKFTAVRLRNGKVKFESAGLAMIILFSTYTIH